MTLDQGWPPSRTPLLDRAAELGLSVHDLQASFQDQSVETIAGWLFGVVPVPLNAVPRLAQLLGLPPNLRH